MGTDSEMPRDRSALADLQGRRLRVLFEEVLCRSAFYARKLGKWALSRPAKATGLPFTTKDELVADQAASPPYGTNLSRPLTDYVRLHQTSGTSGRPLVWLDTAASWEALLGCWRKIFTAIGIRADDRLFFPFSFGPFLGFWTAFEAATRRGLFCLPAGGMSSGGRLRHLLDHRATVVFCTPTYALHLAEAAAAERVDLHSSAVRLVVVAGEPGGSEAAIRERIEQAWGARVIDHCGMTEVGPTGFECLANPGGLHLLETDYFAEVIDPATGQEIRAGETGELVLTTLSRLASPLIRYRTGDLVRVDPRPCPCGLPLVRLDGGLLGRTDDMLHLRGNNVYPSALESVIRRFPEVAEYRIEVDQTAALASLCIQVEPVATAAGENLAERVAQALRDEFHFRADVKAVSPGSLPRFEMKGRRLVIKR